MALPTLHALRRLASSLALCAALAAPAWADGGEGSGALAKPRLFGSFEFIGGRLDALPQWTRVLDKIREETRVYNDCEADIRRCPFPAVAAWRAKVRSVDGLPRHRQMIEINRFLNSWAYREDIENFGVTDFWASPLVFLRRSGDCEDYAIIKYVSLRALGFSPESLRIVVVMDTLRNIAHAVLAIYMDNDIFIMDSLFDAVLTHRNVTFYAPQYSVNETTRWAHIMPMTPSASIDSGASVP